jgi:hypothetical protein
VLISPHTVPVTKDFSTYSRRPTCLCCHKHLIIIIIIIIFISSSSSSSSHHHHLAQSANNELVQSFFGVPGGDVGRLDGVKGANGLPLGKEARSMPQVVEQEQQNLWLCH